MSQFNNKSSRGFTMVEVMVAIFVLSVGLMSAAALMARTYRTSIDSKDTGIATMLCNEKMEDLARYPASDPHVQAPGGTAGSLIGDITQNVTVGPSTTPINYFDDVFVVPQAGTFSEIRTGIDPVSGGPNFTTTTVDPDGNVTTTVATGAPGFQPTFKRRWFIEQDQPIVGLRRITVRVTMPGAPRPVQVQMTMVRP